MRHIAIEILFQSAQFWLRFIADMLRNSLLIGHDGVIKGDDVVQRAMPSNDDTFSHAEPDDSQFQFNVLAFGIHNACLLFGKHLQACDNKAKVFTLDDGAPHRTISCKCTCDSTFADRYVTSVSGS